MKQADVKLKILSTFVLAVFAFFGCKGDKVTNPSSVSLSIESVTPSSLSPGAKLVTVEIRGRGFIGNVSVDPGAGINVQSSSVAGSQRITLVVNVAIAASPGPRTITVTAQGQTTQLTNGFTISSNRAPQAKFIVTPEVGSIQTTYTFDGSSSTDDGSLASYEWTFSDGGTRKGIKVKYKFEQAGNFTARLTVTDNQGGISSAEREIDVLENLPPVAAFSVDPVTGTQETTFTFDASESHDPDGRIARYQWNIDGRMVGGVVVRHRFSAEGQYRVELMVTDSENATGIVRKTIRVELFDREKAIRDIDQVCKEFLRRFGQLESVSAEYIVEGFSTDSQCKGRDREITIIENIQKEIKDSGVQLTDDTVVTNLTQTTASADLRARYYGENLDGSTYDGFSTHHFKMVNEEEGWKICNFTATDENLTGFSLFEPAP